MSRLCENTQYKVLYKEGHHSKGVFILSCETCSSDIEMWEEGSIKTTYSKFKIGQIPCGCSGYKVLTERQQLLRMSRLCKTKGFTVIRKVSGGSKGNFVLSCSVCSLDRELWPEGSIQTTFNNLKCGQSPCGCSRSPSWSVDQIQLRVLLCH